MVWLISSNGITLPDNSESGAPPYGEAEEDIPTSANNWYYNWTRPEGPPKVGLQVGHWKNEEFPEELAKLRGNTGATGGGKTEAEVNLAIANEVAKILRQKGVTVDILPATVPPAYWADAFVAIHADGSEDRTKSGYKIAAPWRDFTQKASKLVETIETTYKEATSLEIDPNITRNMRGYYAFSWWKYTHAIHPMTTAVIVETGFLTNRSDQKLLINHPEIPAQGIANGLIEYLSQEELIKN